MQTFTLKKTMNNNYRVLVDGHVHPLLCGLHDGFDAKQRIKKVLGIDDVKLVSHRFEIGQQYLFVAEKYERSKESNYFSNGFIPWADKFKYLEFLVLECTSQHDVPGEWDDIVQYHGYQFKFVRSSFPIKIKEGDVFVNQYPRASYGQLSDTADWYVNPSSMMEPTDENIKEFRDRWNGHGFGMCNTFQEIGAKLDTIDRSIRGLFKNDATVFEARALKKYLEEILKPAIIGMGFKIVSQPMELRRETGEIDVFEDLLDYTVIPD